MLFDLQDVVMDTDTDPPQVANPTQERHHFKLRFGCVT